MDKYQTVMNALLQDIIDEHRQNRDNHYSMLYRMFHAMRSSSESEFYVNQIMDLYNGIKESNAELDQITDTMLDGTTEDVSSFRTKRDAGVDTITDCLNNVIELIQYKPLTPVCRNVISEYNIRIDAQMRYIRRTKENYDGLLDLRLDRCMLAQ